MNVVMALLMMYRCKSFLDFLIRLLTEKRKISRPKYYLLLDVLTKSKYKHPCFIRVFQSILFRHFKMGFKSLLHLE